MYLTMINYYSINRLMIVRVLEKTRATGDKMLK